MLFRSVLMAWLFALLNWKVVHLTRWIYPEWKEWMHAHERDYAAIMRTAQVVLCLPCIALEPIFFNALMRVEASAEESAALTHAPEMNMRGFYRLMRRGEAWTFISWWDWFVYWIPPSLLWWQFAKRFFMDYRACEL